MNIQLEPRTEADIQAVIGKFADQGLIVKDALIYDGGEFKPAWLDSEGEPIAGIYRDIPIHLYHQIKGISSSMLKVFMLDTAAHYEKAYVLKKTEINEDEDQEKRPDHFTAGDLIHALILEPWDVYSRYYRMHLDEDLSGSLKTASDIESALKAAGEPKSKAGEKKFDKALRLDALGLGILIHDIEVAKLASLNKGKVGIKGDIWDDAHTVYGKFKDREEAQTWIDHNHGLPELSIIVFDEALGIWLRIRPDYLRVLPLIDNIAHAPLMTDVKSTNSARPDSFANDMGKFGYDIQQAFYEMVFRMHSGVDLTAFGFLTAEYKRASIVEPYVLSEKSIKPARQALPHQLARLAECLEGNHWGGYTEGGVTELEIRPFELQRRSSGLNGGDHE